MRLVTAVVGMLVLGLAVLEMVMQPSGEDRLAILAIFGAVAGAGLAVGIAIRRRRAGFASFRYLVLAVAMVSVAVVASAVAISAGFMFISSHDLRLVLVASGLGAALALVLAMWAAAPLADDMKQLGRAAARVGTGDLAVRTGVDRRDEVGAVAAAFDAMVIRLEEASRRRRQEEEARNSFLAAVGHDLRTPLTAMQAAVEALQDGVVGEPDRYLAAIAADVELMSSLVDDLFLLASIEAERVDLELVPIDLTELADEAVEAMTPLALRRGVQLELRSEDRVMVEGGAAQLRRVIRNLLDNAIRFAPEASRIRIDVVNGRGSATVLVEDEGPGFPSGFEPRAFEPFARFEPARSRGVGGGGAGLGLAIAKGLVEAHGGEIWIEPGPGGRVGFSLPAEARRV